MGIFSKFFSKKQKEIQENPQQTQEQKATLDRGLDRSRQGLLGKIAHAVAGRSTIDDDVLDELEEAFITSDVGTDTTLEILDRIRARVAKDKYLGSEELNALLCDEICQMLAEPKAGAEALTPNEGNDPFVIMVVGVNGVGKTTTIGKLAAQFSREGLKVVLGAADTFRAAAIEQLQTWGDRAGVPVVKQQTGSDPAAVAFDTLQSAKAAGADVVIIDTAGRLHNKKGLMDELTKIRRVMERVVPGAPHEVLLVLDGSTGQNAFEQARRFAEATKVTAMAITKLDGTAKGGVVIGISNELRIPVKYIGLGEGIDDLQMFDKQSFVKSLFNK